MCDLLHSSIKQVRAVRVDCGESQARQVTSASGSTYLSLQAAQPNNRLIRNEKNEWNSVNMYYKLNLRVAINLYVYFF